MVWCFECPNIGVFSFVVYTNYHRSKSSFSEYLTSSLGLSPWIYFSAPIRNSKIQSIVNHTHFIRKENAMLIIGENWCVIIKWWPYFAISIWMSLSQWWLLSDLFDSVCHRSDSFNTYTILLSYCPNNPYHTKDSLYSCKIDYDRMSSTSQTRSSYWWW